MIQYLKLDGNDELKLHIHVLTKSDSRNRYELTMFVASVKAIDVEEEIKLITDKGFIRLGKEVVINDVTYMLHKDDYKTFGMIKTDIVNYDRYGKVRDITIDRPILNF